MGQNPGWQDLYFTDGHVEGKGEDYYRDDLTSSAGGNWGACTYPGMAWGGPFFYWEGTPRQ